MLGGDYLGSKDIKLEIAGGIMYTSENEDQITSNRRHQKELVVVSFLVLIPSYFLLYIRWK